MRLLLSGSQDFGYSRKAETIESDFGGRNGKRYMSRKLKTNGVGYPLSHMCEAAGLPWSAIAGLLVSLLCYPVVTNKSYHGT